MLIHQEERTSLNDHHPNNKGSKQIKAIKLTELKREVVET